MSTATIEADPVRAAWLEKRRDSIGSSEAAAALGMSPHEDDTPLRLYLRKIGEIEGPEENEAMWWGTEMEPLIAKRYAMEFDVKFRYEQLFLRHPEHAWMSATLDRVREDGRIVELKTIGLRSAGMLGLEGTDEVPPSWVLQVQHQMIVHGSDAADIAAVVGGQEPRFYTIHRDDRLCRLIVEREAEFWRRIQERRPPDPIPGRDGRLMAVLYPEPAGQIEASPAVQAITDRWERLGEEIREKTEERKRLHDELLRAMEHTEYALLMDGRRLKRWVVKTEDRVQPVKGSTYPQLRIVKGTSR
jgi:putative phage-type endonuclease